MKILVVDDEALLVKGIRFNLQSEGYEVITGTDGLEAVKLVQEQKPDLVILDVMMPRLDGFSACREIRKVSESPIIILSARTEEYDKLFGFELGVDDYVVKPFSPKELMARIRVILERGKKHSGQDILKFEGLVIDVPGRSVTVDGRKAPLTPKEIDLLLYLVQNPNVAMSRQKLLEEVWNFDYFGDDRTVDTHIKMLRRNLGPYREHIVTVRGMGYKFEA